MENEMTVREALGYFYSIMLVEMAMHGTAKPYLEKYLADHGYMNMEAASFPSVFFSVRLAPKSADGVLGNRTKVQRFFWMFVMFCELHSREDCISLMLEPKDRDIARLAKYAALQQISAMDGAAK